MKTKLLLLLFLGSIPWVVTQAQNGGEGILVDHVQSLESQATHVLPEQDLDAFRNMVVQNPGVSYAGRSAEMVINFDNYDIRTDEHTGEKYRLVSLNLERNDRYSAVILYFENFDLQGSDKFSIVTGADNENGYTRTYSRRNNQNKGAYASGFIPVTTETVYMKLSGSSSKVTVSNVGYIYKSAAVGVPGYSGLNNSRDCIRSENINCPEYSEWCDPKRSVFKMCMVDANGTMFYASGALINNERKDGAPLALTAAHNIRKIENEKTIFMFNYESPNCSNLEGILNHTVQGSVVLDSAWKTDYAALRITEDIPKEYNVFYAGWNNDTYSGGGNNPLEGAAITHPLGDIKKITTFKKRLKKKTRPFPNGQKVWKMKVDKGGAQDGSSGGPLFTSNKRIVGQVKGPDQKVNDPWCKAHLYGRFYVSWHKYGLSWILNPNGTHSGDTKFYLKYMDGHDPCVPNYYFTDATDLHTSANVTFANYAGTWPRTYNGVYVTSGGIAASQSVAIQPNTYVEFDAGTQVELKPGFHAKTGSEFLAHVDGCIPQCGRPYGEYKTEPISNTDPNHGVGIFEGEELDYDENSPEEIDDTEYEGYEDDWDEEGPEEAPTSDMVNIFPNPAAVNYTVEFNGENLERIEIYSSTGILLQVIEAEEGQNQYAVQIEETTAFHVVHVITQQGVIVEQVGIAQ
ncbi:T9SS type A sorting domain-containing protein [bacterium SCSIO 12741]|nr:T9SS type A sorting domain-containing protein [bacterium SCSIO 12741]